MAIINEEIGNIFLAPPRSVLIRRFLSNMTFPKVSLPDNLPS